MCDERTFKESDDYLAQLGTLSRRQFNAITVSAGLAMLFPHNAAALEVNEEEINIKTPDGEADCYFVHPSSGARPGVLIWPDAMGLRPAFRAMGKRLAESGYSVLVVNPYYRTQPAPIIGEGDTFADPDTRNKIMSLMGTLTAETNVTDARAFIGFLDAQKSVDTKRKMGTTGYCMGGPMTMRTAAAFPERVGAGASFHGGRLVTDGTDSPHLLVPKMKASYLFAIADNDDKAQPEAKTVLRKAFAKAGLAAEIEVYQGTMHGWCPPDTPMYDEAQAERAWARLLVLFETALS